MRAFEEPPAWKADGACVDVDPAIFFPDKGTTSRTSWDDEVALARRWCDRCPVFVECHDWAIHNEGDGIWAATDPMARRRIRSALGITLATPVDEDDEPPADPLDEADELRNAS